MKSQVVPGWVFAVTAMAVLQFAAALTTQLYPIVGPAGAGWLRLVGGAVVFLALVRPDFRSYGHANLRLLIGLGLATALMTVSFQFAVATIGLSMTVPIQFLGPLTVGVVRAKKRSHIWWPVIALAGVVAVTQPWKGSIDPWGVMWALFAACGWAFYIVLTQSAGDRVSGFRALAVTIPVAAIAATFVGLPSAWGHLDVGVVLAGLGLGILMPVIPFALELVALQRLTASAFGTLSAGEPALAAIFGVTLLGEHLDLIQIAGIGIVIVAAVAAERTGRRARTT
jgi:inner membrane transporter RhtA